MSDLYRIAVVAHQARREQAEKLKTDVGAGLLSIDDGTLGCDRNHRKAWTWLADNADDASWLVVLEDDAVPITDFRDQLDKVLAAASTDIVSLYLGTGFPPHWQNRIRQAVAQAETQGASFILGNFIHGVAICIRTRLVPDMLDYTSKCTGMAFDRAIQQWARDRNHPIAATYPSLVDHHDGPSLAAHPDGGTRNIPRKAHKVGGRNTWTKRTVNL